MHLLLEFVEHMTYLGTWEACAAVFRRPRTHLHPHNADIKRASGSASVGKLQQIEFRIIMAEGKYIHSYVHTRIDELIWLKNAG